ncbi:MAG: hypothetical protein K2X27_09695 [Candidatus Obscuribacterales bacterium]|nr:hypothetical protein [Candidatus Obscuribacterales bacterium]
MKDLLQTCKTVCASNAEFVWFDDETLLRSKVAPWTELPLWIPESDQEHRGFLQIDSLKAQNQGLSYRTLEETIEATLAWDLKRDQSMPLKAGLTRAKEEEILNSVLSF